MYLTILTLHNISRWLVVIFGLIAIVRAFRGWLSKRDWQAQDDRFGKFYVMFFDIQVLLGLILYFGLSAITVPAFRNFGAAMGVTATRYFLVEHLGIMLIALVVAHIGRARASKAAQAVQKHKTSAIFFTASFLLLLAGIPWPFLQGVGRPFLRLFGLDF